MRYEVWHWGSGETISRHRTEAAALAAAARRNRVLIRDCGRVGMRNILPVYRVRRVA